MNRTYQKESIDGDRFVRFETEFGRDYARALGYDLTRGRITRDMVVNGEIDRRKGIPLVAWFRVENEGKYQPKPERKKERAKIEKWYIDTVIPSLTRYANSHDCDERVIQRFVDACKKKG